MFIFFLLSFFESVEHSIFLSVSEIFCSLFFLYVFVSTFYRLTDFFTLSCEVIVHPTCKIKHSRAIPRTNDLLGFFIFVFLFSILFSRFPAFRSNTIYVCMSMKFVFFNISNVKCFLFYTMYERFYTQSDQRHPFERYPLLEQRWKIRVYLFSKNLLKLVIISPLLWRWFLRWVWPTFRPRINLFDQ